jgi:uncharacterized protein YjbI with pentapeptide repeats
VQPIQAECGREPGCKGISIGSFGACLEHLTPEQQDAVLRSLNDKVVDVRGTRISAALLGRLLDAVRGTQANGYGSIRLSGARFDGARFTEDATFINVQFDGATFDGARFDGIAKFFGSEFRGATSFKGVRFNRIADFMQTTFTDRTTFDDTEFRGVAKFTNVQFRDASFQRARFRRTAEFPDAQFHKSLSLGNARFAHDAVFRKAQFGGASFERVQFEGEAMFSEATFSGEALFERAQFAGPTVFRGAEFIRTASFERAQFATADRLGPLIAHKLFVLDRASFEGTVLVAMVSPQVSCVLTTFKGPVTLRFRFADVVLDGAVFIEPSSLAFAESPFEPDHVERVERQLRQAGRDARPRLLSLRRVDVSNLVLTDVDLQWCLFRGAHRLDQLRIEGPKHFATTPTRRAASAAAPECASVWRWTRRRTLAEEHMWRVRRQFRRPRSRRPQQCHPQVSGWTPPPQDLQELVHRRSGQQIEQPEPEYVAALYRALRKAEEDSKHEPGAADFYYGEMEMRRLADETPWIERQILRAYWLVSGYALRAARALLTLLIVLLVAAALTAGFGFKRSSQPPSGSLSGTITGSPPAQELRLSPLPAPKPRPQRSFIARFGTAWWISLEAAMFRSADQTLNPTGRHIQTSVRFIGPFLLGLALLSVRGRVKR